jgi:hypothetical protein
MTLCQLVKAIDDFNGKFGIGGVGDVFRQSLMMPLSNITLKTMADPQNPSG